MTANEYQKAALRTANTESSFTSRIRECVYGIVGEVGEVVDLVKKFEFQGHPIIFADIAEEIGDVAWYLAVLSAVIGYDFDNVLTKNVDKLRDRYPDGFDPQRSVHREAQKP